MCIKEARYRYVNDANDCQIADICLTYWVSGKLSRPAMSPDFITQQCFLVM